MTLENIIELDKKYYMNTFGGRTKVCFERGEGIYLYDVSGKKYVDFFSGIAVNSLGHCHPKVVNAVCEQVKKLMHCSNLYYIKNQALLAQMICKNSVCDRVFFTNSGAEANEGAIKLARAYFKKKGMPQKYEFVCLDKSFHGRTLTTATATGQDKYKEPYTPLTPGFKHVPINDMEALENAVNENTCAILLEVVQGESGVHLITKEYAQFARELCDKHGIFLIIDEVQTGIGRTGKLFAYETVGIEPDIFTLAKALGNGFPIGAICAKEEAAKGFQPGDHGTTFGGNPLACAAALASLSTIIEEDMPRKAEEMGKYLRDKIEGLNLDCISEIRNVGLMFAIEFKEPIAADVKNKMFEKGYLIGSVGANALRILPPLIITESDVDGFVDTLYNVLN